MFIKSTWPKSAGEYRPPFSGFDYKVLDWKTTVDAVCQVVNEGSVVQMTFGNGVKFAVGRVAPEARPIASATGVPGQCHRAEDGGVLVECLDGMVRLEKVATEGFRVNWWRVTSFDGIKALMDVADDRDVVLTFERYPNFGAVINFFSARVKAEDSTATEGEDPDPYETTAVHLNREWLFGLFRAAKLKPGDRFLDIGCWFKPWASMVARDYGLEVWGADLMDDDAFKDKLPWFNYFRGDIADFPVTDVKFDFIFAHKITPFARSPRLDFPELLQLRDRLLANLSDKGGMYLSFISNNTGARKNEDDYGNLTAGDVHDWIGKDFPHRRYFFSRFVGFLGSRQGFDDSWKTMTGYRGNLAAEWNRNRRVYISDHDYARVLARVGQAFLDPAEPRRVRNVTVVGGGVLARDLTIMLRTMHAHYLDSIRHVERLPANEPVADDTFIFCMPGVNPETIRARGIYQVTYEELLARWATRDYYMVGAEQDAVAVRPALQRILAAEGGKEAAPVNAPPGAPGAPPPAKPVVISNYDGKERSLREWADLTETSLNSGYVFQARHILSGLRDALGGSLPPDVAPLETRLKAAEADRRDLHVVVVGDSLGLPRPVDMGTFDEFKNPEMFTRFDQTYPALLERKLAGTGRFPRVSVTNRCVRRATIEIISASVRENMFWFDPDVFVIHSGVVDCWTRGENGEQLTPLDRYRTAFERIFERGATMRPGMITIVLGIARSDPRRDELRPGLRKQIALYNQYLAEACQRNGATFIDVESLHDEDQPHRIVSPLDGCHLSNSGHALYADLLYKVIMEAKAAS